MVSRGRDFDLFLLLRWGWRVRGGYDVGQGDNSHHIVDSSFEIDDLVFSHHSRIALMTIFE